MSDAFDTEAVETGMGPLELAVYRGAFRKGRTYRRQVTAVDFRSAPEAAAETIPEEASGDDAEGAVKSVFARLRLAEDPEASEWEELPLPSDQVAPTPGRVASLLLVARAFDDAPGLIEAIRRREPVVVIVEVPDSALLSRIALRWQSALGLDELSFRRIDLLSDTGKRSEQDALSLIVKQPIPLGEQAASDARAYVSVQMALPILVFCPQAARHLSRALTDAATHRLTLPKIDRSLIARTVSAVTGSRCRSTPSNDVVREIGLHELLLAVRFDRTPAECIEALGSALSSSRRLASISFFSLI
jgi:hypothetical protein